MEPELPTLEKEEAAERGFSELLTLAEAAEALRMSKTQLRNHYQEYGGTKGFGPLKFFKEIVCGLLATEMQKCQAALQAPAPAAPAPVKLPTPEVLAVILKSRRRSSLPTLAGQLPGENRGQYLARLKLRQPKPPPSCAILPSRPGGVIPDSNSPYGFWQHRGVCGAITKKGTPCSHPVAWDGETRTYLKRCRSHKDVP